MSWLDVWWTGALVMWGFAMGVKHDDDDGWAGEVFCAVAALTWPAWMLPLGVLVLWKGSDR